MYYMLSPAIKTGTTLSTFRTSSGRRIFNAVLLEPNKKYNTYIDDAVYVESLKNQKAKIPYSEQAVAELKALNIAYDVQQCPSCGGRVKNLKFDKVVFYED